MAPRSTVRASDADRERVAERLRTAAAEGRILAEELEHRLERALRARTYGELDEQLRDLPGKRVARRRRHPELVTAQAVAIAVTSVAALVLVGLLAAVAIAGAIGTWIVWVFVWMLFGRRGRFPLLPGAHRRRRGGAGRSANLPRNATF